MALAEAHWESAPGDLVRIRFSDLLSPGRIEDLLSGSGFAPHGPGPTLERVLTLPDTVAPEMGLLICGLNPSIYAAEVGVGFGRPGNRFWPAAMDAGLVTTDRDPRAALVEHGVGMTDLVKRATRRADELVVAEYRQGLDRVERLADWLQPAVVCFVGLAGWRAAVERKATAGLQARRLGERPVYVMPSTSGLNAHSTRQDLAAHLSAAAALSD